LNIREGTHDVKKYDELYTSHVESAENWNLLTVTIKEKMGSAHDVENAVLRMQLKIREKEKYVWHPTQKPLEMIERLIKISSNEWDTVLDCYLWSWTTAVACKNTNRNFIGIEINPEYVEIAKNRLKEVDRINQQRLF
jgi:DNA modification methylase